MGRFCHKKLFWTIQPGPVYFHYYVHRPTTTNTPSTCKVTIHSVSKALISLRVVCQAVAIQAKQASLSKSELVGLFIEHYMDGSLSCEDESYKHDQSIQSCQPLIHALPFMLFCFHISNSIPYGINSLQVVLTFLTFAYSQLPSKRVLVYQIFESIQLQQVLAYILSHGLRTPNEGINQ